MTIAACRQRSLSTQTSGDSPVSFCDLARTPGTYNSRAVRVQGILIGYHETALYDAACDPNVKFIRTDFDSSSHRKLVDGIESLGGSGFQHGNFWANVVLVARFEKIPDADCTRSTVESGMPGRSYVNYCYRLVVSDVSQVSAVPANVEWPK
jgi:hypothetical protein